VLHVAMDRRSSVAQLAAHPAAGTGL
jgi:hypothetical protein